MAPPFSHPVSLSVPSGIFPICSPPLQTLPFFRNRSGGSSVPGSMFIPYLIPATPCINQSSNLNVSSSYIYKKEDLDSGSSGRARSGNNDRADDFKDIATDLELKMPGSKSQKEEKGKQPLMD